MNCFKPFLCLFGALAPLAFLLPAKAASDEWTIVPQQSKISFVTLRGTHIPATGSFSNISGKIKFDGKSIKLAGVEANIPLSTIFTGINKRDSDLKSPKFFDISTFANASFKSFAVRETDEKRYLLAGELLLHGVKKNVDLAFALPQISTSSGKQRLQAAGSTVLIPFDYALDLKPLHPEGKVRVDMVEIQVSIVAEKSGK